VQFTTTYTGMSIGESTVINTNSIQASVTNLK